MTMIFDKIVERIAKKIAEYLKDSVVIDQRSSHKLILIEGTTAELLKIMYDEYVDIKTIEEKVGISERGLRSMLKVLEEINFVKTLTLEKGKKMYKLNDDIKPYLILKTKPEEKEKLVEQ